MSGGLCPSILSVRCRRNADQRVAIVVPSAARSLTAALDELELLLDVGVQPDDVQTALRRFRCLFESPLVLAENARVGMPRRIMRWRTPQPVGSRGLARRM